MTLLEQLAASDAVVVTELVESHGGFVSATDRAAWDNNPTWDNWTKTPAPFDNRPTWDNWNKKK
ncbi:multiple cyclophane-containing RiPP AmcA [Streptomyces jumonjinensis]|uniref:Uncharacterized protein n=1 Tax=Streptomyces jumonjinensis TaxID=1945 RepID=A0A646KB41_STRJU|nr:multiple cyclophane-containing RiPP AmcA [Streptomyces jumonjinensis]MQS99478.1 hypothetical protein [Streptomyces jumonjinensis]